MSEELHAPADLLPGYVFRYSLSMKLVVTQRGYEPFRLDKSVLKHMCTTWFYVPNFCILPKVCFCMFRMLQKKKAIISLNGVNVWCPIGSTVFYGKVQSENPRIMYVNLSVSKGYKYFDCFAWCFKSYKSKSMILRVYQQIYMVYLFSHIFQ
jgi:uncharacterized protein YjhX (UPF0386 family)